MGFGIVVSAALRFSTILHIDKIDCGAREKSFLSDSIFSILLNIMEYFCGENGVEFILADKKFSRGIMRVPKHWAVEYAKVWADIFWRL